MRGDVLSDGRSAGNIVELIRRLLGRRDHKRQELSYHVAGGLIVNCLHTRAKNN